jgi:hypothetical protein
MLFSLHIFQERTQRVSWLLLVLLVACSTPPPPPPLPTVQHIPTRVVSCQDLDAPWAAGDWVNVLQILGQLERAQQTCGDNSLAPKKYAAHINHATALQQQGNPQQAIQAYRAALALNGNGREALDALFRLQALPPPTTPPCIVETLTDYPTTGAKNFARIKDKQIWVGDKPFLIRGVNYYPRKAPWDRFLPESDVKDIEQEFNLIAQAGFNTLRIFLKYDALFTCEPERAVPNVSAFAKLDRILELARERNLKLVVTLNDLPDLYFRPLYTDWTHHDAQTIFIVQRYRDEPTILMWDLRNEGDLDYDVFRNGRFTRDAVLKWLEHSSSIVRANDSNHLLTAGWFGDASETLPSVDVLSFHHWVGAQELVTRIKGFSAKTSAPILLQEVGYSGTGNDGETSQATSLRTVIEYADKNTAGWLIWSAFDFVTESGPAQSPEHFFGLWRADLQPKPALHALPITPNTP